ncbi:transcriptional regulator [Xylophilus ampelinus]|uniref:YdaS antitoxin of YdaST toxin-antitoxin system n=1 Tax=Xylophilus ampelinus TaxID=54067 RepID=A0A318SX82_9BURK|nr:Cro/CI family transcriptional regulator [Xylophilus ampelinus]MCS4508910.1 helix-turn-helix domain-containing protein [Xylophilus ampelinus]PYE79477.1 YdaS antitoxin of YdaST toxin-antitoxin system [Xylophilus ampelinus]
MEASNHAALRRAVAICGSQRALAKLLGITPVAVGQWLRPDTASGRDVPPKQCVRIETITDRRVTRRDLRPDDWAEIWPELADSTPNLPQPSASQRQPATESIAEEVSHV